MKKYIQYLNYVIKHKWYVAIECFKMGLIWQGIIHDMSKFLPNEFVPYARFFHGKKKKQIRDKTGYYKPTDTGDTDFDFAWFLHQKRNPHHWQYWICPDDNKNIKVFEIPHKYVKEMVCDWIGAGKAQGYFSPSNDPLLETRKWWEANNKKMLFHLNTRKKIEQMLYILNNK